MKKRVLSVILSACILLCISQTVFAAVTTYRVWVQGVQVTSENCNDILGDGTVNYNPNTKTLTLSNASVDGAVISDISGKVFSAGVYSYDDISISLEGSNSIGDGDFSDQNTEFSSAVCSNGRITVSGNASLYIQSYEHTKNSYGIYSMDSTASGGVHINNCMLEVRSDNAGTSAYGIYAAGGTVKFTSCDGDAFVDITSGMATVESCGIRANSIEFNSSIVSVISLPGQYSRGIYADGSITVESSSEITVISQSQGVTANKLKVTNSEISAEGPSYAFKILNGVEASAGTKVTGAKSNTVSSNSEVTLKQNSDAELVMIKDLHVHTYGQWSYNDSIHWRECAECGEGAEIAGHSYKWVTDRPASSTQTGLRHQACDVCGKTGKSEEIPKVVYTTAPNEYETPTLPVYNTTDGQGGITDDITYDHVTDLPIETDDNGSSFSPYESDSGSTVPPEDGVTDTSDGAVTGGDVTGAADTDSSVSPDTEDPAAPSEDDSGSNGSNKTDADSEKDADSTDGEKGSLAWLWILLAVIVIAAGGAAVYVFLVKKKSEK